MEELRNTENVEYQTILLELINCIIVYADKIEDRVRIRNEFFGKLYILSESLLWWVIPNDLFWVSYRCLLGFF